MCGIAGIMTTSGRVPDQVSLKRMAEALDHRGPESRGYFALGNIGMVQNRLAIIDLKTGQHPLYEPGGAALVGNGEIYNYLELREDAALAGVNYATNSDFEPALYLYHWIGLAFVERPYAHQFAT